jgi:hypothetical protein
MISLQTSTHRSTVVRTAVARLTSGRNVHVTLTLRDGRTIVGTLTDVVETARASTHITLRGYRQDGSVGSATLPGSLIRTMRTTNPDTCPQCHATDDGTID